MTSPKTSISNIAWPAEHDGEALDLVIELGFDGVELAPAKVLGPLAEARSADIARYRDALRSRGLEVSALQAILFGATDAHLFSGEAERSRLAERLVRVAEVAGELGARACVFGSPGLRDPGDLPVTEALGMAVDFFGSVAPAFARHGTTLAFEANPPIYDCRFVTRTPDAIDLVSRVDAPGFALQLDMGTVFANGEDDAALRAAAAMAAHCHASEPHLAVLGTGGHDHAGKAAILHQAGYAGWVSIEMRGTQDWQGAMRSAADVLRTTYAART